MSRISGVLRKDIVSNDNQLLSRMAAKQSNGDWDYHVFSSGKATFSWCGWSFPKSYEGKGVIVVIDGHIFNRNELGKVKCDAELFSQLYERYGFKGALEKLNGDFAIALYDLKSDMLWLARDRFGLKPLYYVNNKEFFSFASRPGALLILPGVTREVNRQFVALFAGSHYRTFDNNPDQSAYKDIAQLPAANMLCVKNGKITREVYWQINNLSNFTDSEEDLAQQYRELLLDAVKIRVQSADNPAFTLSGGMDSSSILASSVHIFGKKQHAFSSVYEDKTYDESTEIRDMLEDTVQEWHQIKIDIPDVFSIVEQMIDVHDEPVATATWLSHFLLCQDVEKKGFKSLFGGLGGDELNAGEYEHFLFYFADLKKNGKQYVLDEEIKYWVQYHDHPIFKKNTNVVEEGLARLVDPNHSGRCLPDRIRIDRYAHVLNPDYFNLKDFNPIMDHPFESYLKNRTYQDIFRETIPCCLRTEDRQTVAFGIDNFLPFYDHRLCEFMFRIGGDLKIRKGVTKYLLREAMKGILPEVTRTRVKKSGWNAPAHVWFSGKGKDRLMDMVSSKSFCSKEIYNVKELKNIIEQHDEIVSSQLMKDNHMMFLWQLVNLEIWLKKGSENDKS